MSSGSTQLINAADRIATARTELAAERIARQRAETRLADCQRQLAELRETLQWELHDGPDINKVIC